LTFTDSLVTVLILWGIPGFMVVRAYLKMSRAEKNEALSDFRKPQFIFTIGFMVTGAFAAHVGRLISIPKVGTIGIMLLFTGLVVSAIQTWKFSKRSSAFIISIALVLVIFL
jgi:hypothetical protein